MKTIWVKDMQHIKNCSLAFVLSSSINTNNLKLEMVAINIYRLFVNGELVGYGPARAGHGYVRKDSYDLSSYIMEGLIVIMETIFEIKKRFYMQNRNLEVLENKIDNAIDSIICCYKNGGKVLICGNGGSAADSEHIVGELMKGFKRRRPVKDSDTLLMKAAFSDDAEHFINSLQTPLEAISLVSQCSLISAYNNDVSSDMVYAQQVYGYLKKNDILIALSTTGNSANVVNAVKLAKILGGKTIGFTGETGGEIAVLADILINVPAHETYRVQELHMPVYHYICEAVECNFFNE